MKRKMTPIEGAECLECMQYRQIPSDACVIAWEYVKRHRSHHDCLQTLLIPGHATFNSENVSASEVYNRMQVVYGTECMSGESVSRWCRSFRSGRSSSSDRSRHGQSHVIFFRYENPYTIGYRTA